MHAERPKLGEQLLEGSILKAGACVKENKGMFI